MKREIALTHPAACTQAARPRDMLKAPGIGWRATR